MTTINSECRRVALQWIREDYLDISKERAKALVPNYLNGPVTGPMVRSQAFRNIGKRLRIGSGR